MVDRPNGRPSIKNHKISTRRQFMRWTSALGSAVSALLVGGTVVTCPTAVEAQAQSFDMKIGFITINDSQHETAKWFATEIDKRTGGRIKARVFPAGQLGGIPRQVEGVQLGTQEAFFTPPAFFVGVAPAFQAGDAPGLFYSLDHQHKALNHPSVRDKWLRLAETAGVIGVMTWSAGEPAIATREPVRKVADLNGLKIRVLATPVERALASAVGANGMPMDYGEVLAALQNRVLDGARSAIVVMGPSKFYTVTKYVTIIADNYIPSGMWLSKTWLGKLPGELQKAIMETARDVTPHSLQWSKEITRKWEEEWTKNSGEVIRLSAADRKQYMERVQPLGEKLLGGHDNPQVREMYQLLATAARATAS
jgi:TRAP-type C4-dicarboxylate transport system substrate-binding protein